MQSYAYDTQTIICYAQSSKCPCVKFGKNFGELFHNFGELFHNFGELFHNFGGLFHNFGELFHNFGELFHNFGELFHNFGELFHNFGSLDQLELGSLISFAISVYLFTIFHYSIGPFWLILVNFAKS